MYDTYLILVVDLKYNFFFVTKIRIHNHEILSVAHTVRDLLMATKCFHQRVTYVQGDTTAGGSG